LEQYRWSSYPAYVGHVHTFPNWLHRDRLLSACGLDVGLVERCEKRCYNARADPSPLSGLTPLRADPSPFFGKSPPKVYLLEFGDALMAYL
ncbi:MAG: hypothetical protein V3V05_04930, partial [Pontiella sp.]